MARMKTPFAAIMLAAALVAGCEPAVDDVGTCAPSDFTGLMALARKGNTTAKYNVAIMYLTGNGTARDERAAAEWMAKAALDGEVDAQFNLAAMYDRGLGVPKSVLDSLKWYRIAAENGQV